MRITTRIVELELKERFTISRGAQDVAEVVHVEIEHAGERGFGEAAPVDRYHESPVSAQTFVEQHAELLGDDPFALAEIQGRLRQLPGEQAAKSALDAALHDLQGKLVGLPVWRLLGLGQEGPPTSYTVVLADPDEMAQKAERDSPRFLRLKLKLGGRDGLDLDRVRAVREVTDVPLQVDANEAWSLDEALLAMPALAELGVEYCEQPLPAGDPGGAELKRRSPIPLYVDEDCHTLPDVAVCAERAHGINIKLAKSGGIREAVRMIHAARALGLGVMLGCMLESGLGIAAAAQIASLCDHVDLDGNLLLRRDPWPGVRFEEGRQLPANAPGLGVAPGGAAPTQRRRMYRHAPEQYDCPFCAVVRGEERPPWTFGDDVVWRDDVSTAWVNRRWWANNPGNIVLVPNRHVENIYELDRELAAGVHETARRIALAMKGAYGCGGVSTRQHNEPAGDQEVWHYHLHVFPRWKGDDLYRSPHRLTTAEERRPYAERLRAALEAAP